MAKCSCYHTKEVRDYLFDPITREPIPYNQTVGVCYGTKERDECSCGGDECKCDFYPEKRYRGNVSLVDGRPEGIWIISCDGYYPYCSRCAYEPERPSIHNDNRTPYCPHCGAKMDGKRKEQE